MRALITGGKGFVGTWLAEHCREAGDDVVLTDVEIDIADVSAMGSLFEEARPEVVYHLAARTHVGESWEDPGEVLRVNVLGTASVLAAARRIDARVLVVSSAEVYGIVDEGSLPIDEAAPLAPATPYAASKAAAEQVALQAWRGYGQHVVVVRPFNHVGPGQAPTFAVSGLARRVVEARRAGGGDLPIGNLAARRDFTDVRDVVRAYRLLADAAPAGTVCNVCSGTDVAIEEIARRLVEASGVELALRVDPALARPVDLPVLRGDGAVLRKLTGWEPEISLSTTLADVLAWWEAELP